MLKPERTGADRNSGILEEQAKALLSGQHDRVVNAALLSSLLYHSLDQVNWAGFYFLQGSELIVGPFQGLPACVSIPLGKGVCGTAAEKRCAVRVADVNDFDGHIACDAASRSEIVLPLIKNGELIGVLDLDSPVENRFDEEDERLLLRIAEIFVNSLA